MAGGRARREPDPAVLWPLMTDRRLTTDYADSADKADEADEADFNLRLS